MTTEQKILELPNYAAMYFGVERMRTYPEIDCGHDGAGFDSDDLKALAASYREMAKTVERYERMIAKADLMDFEGDFCIQQWNGGVIGTRYDEDGVVLQQVKAETALAAFERLVGERDPG